MEDVLGASQQNLVVWEHVFTMKHIRHTAERIIRKLKTDEHPITRELVIADPVLSQVGVLHRRQAHRASHMVDELFRLAAVFLLQAGADQP